MIQVHQNRLNMYNNVDSLFDQNSAIIASVPQLKTSCAAFKTCIGKIKKTSTDQLREISGITRAKQMLRASVVHNSAKMAAGIKTYAHKNKMYQLEAEMDMSENFISRQTDIVLLQTIDLINGNAVQYATNLVEFGIEAEEITTFTALVTEFAEKYNNPAMAIERRKFYTEQLTLLFAEAKDIVHNELDSLILVISDKQPEFYKLYKNARVIYNRRGKSQKQMIEEGLGTVYVTTSASIDGSILENVKTDLIENGVTIDTAYSDENGEVTFDDVKPGKYIVESSQETFNPKQSEEFSIIPGDEITIEITLDAALE